MSSDCRPDPSNPLSSCGTRIGITFVAQSACLSFIAVVSLLIYVFFVAFKNRHGPGRGLIGCHLDLYLLGLFISDLIQSIGGVMNIRWVAMAGIAEGGFCTAQGVMKQFGDVGVALCSLAIAVHTFAVLFLRWKEPKSFLIPLVVLGLYALFLTLIVGIGYAVHRHSGYYGNTIYWCWIKRDFFKLGIGLQYLWFWIAGLGSLMLYVPVFLVLKRIIVVEHTDEWTRYCVRRTTPDERRMSPKIEGVNPRQMLFYPAVYIITVVPSAIVRLPTLKNPNHPIPFPALVFGAMLLSASGLFNVIVYSTTRPALLRPSAMSSDPLQQIRDHTPQLFWSDGDQGDTELRSLSSQPTALDGHELPLQVTKPPELR